MKTTIYCSYGVLAHEKKNYYSVDGPASDIYDKIEVNIPDEIVIGKNAFGELILNLDGTKYLLSEVLTNADDDPVLRWYNGKTYKTINL